MKISNEVDHVPRHIAIIMDGNGRWATGRKLSRSEGHRAGVRAIEPVVKECDRLGVKVLSLFAFSTENWKRPAAEVGALMELFREFFLKKTEALIANGVHIRLIGDRDTMSAPERLMAEQAERLSKENHGLLLQIAFNYGAQNELIGAARRLAARAAKGELSPSAISQKDFEEALYSAYPVDLLIRTGGDMRISNFLLYQSAYAELSFVREYWPDFTPEVLRREISAFENKERRFGGLGEQGESTGGTSADGKEAQ